MMPSAPVAAPNAADDLELTVSNQSKLGRSEIDRGGGRLINWGHLLSAHERSSHGKLDGDGACRSVFPHVVVSALAHNAEQTGQ